MPPHIIDARQQDTLDAKRLSVDMGKLGVEEADSGLGQLEALHVGMQN